jgi:hypothetical protein
MVPSNERSRMIPSVKLPAQRSPVSHDSGLPPINISAEPDLATETTLQVSSHI